MLPLYTEVKAGISANVDANKGLVFDRFFEYGNDFSKVEANQKSNFLKKFVNKAGHLGVVSQIDAAVDRQFRLVSNFSGSSMAFKSDWHWVTGLGNAHPVENGFSWHPVLGMPYLAGSSVKGLLRTWIECYAEDCEKQAHKDKVSTWFGSSTSDEPAAGCVVFFDAIPIAPCKMVMDVMTPHLGGWYKNGADGSEKNAPADWHTPVPVNFLACKELSLMFSFAPRPGYELPEDDKQYLEQSLQDALAFLGAGAKTSSGYGYMTFLESELDDLYKAEEEALAAKEFESLSKQMQKIKELENQYETNASGVSISDVEALIEEALTWLADDKQALYNVLKQYYLTIKHTKKLKSRKEKAGKLLL